MTRSTTTEKRFGRYRDFRYPIRWGDRVVAGFGEAGALMRTVDVVEYRSGSRLSGRKCPQAPNSKRLSWSVASAMSRSS